MTEHKHEFAVYNIQAKNVESVHLTKEEAEQALDRRTVAAGNLIGQLFVISVPAWRPPANPHVDSTGLPVEDDPAVVAEQKETIAAEQKAAAADAEKRAAEDALQPEPRPRHTPA